MSLYLRLAAKGHLTSPLTISALSTGTCTTTGSNAWEPTASTGCTTWKPCESPLVLSVRVHPRCALSLPNNRVQCVFMSPFQLHRAPARSRLPPAQPAGKPHRSGSAPTAHLLFIVPGVVAEQPFCPCLCCCCSGVSMGGRLGGGSEAVETILVLVRPRGLARMPCSACPPPPPLTHGPKASRTPEATKMQGVA